MGWLIGQALRAVRVILDIGLHCEMRIPDSEPFHPGEVWQADWGHAVPDPAHRPSAQFLASEVDRYLGTPGQAISYKIGERVWLEGRDEARRRMGDAFDLVGSTNARSTWAAMGLDQLRVELGAIGPGRRRSRRRGGDAIEEPVDEVLGCGLAVGDVAARFLDELVRLHAVLQQLGASTLAARPTTDHRLGGLRMELRAEAAAQTPGLRPDTRFGPTPRRSVGTVTTS